MSEDRSLALTGLVTFVGVSGDEKTYTVAKTHLSYRNYYNLRKRLEQEKKVKDFSANYTTLLVDYMPDFGEHCGNKLAFGAAWGMQRNTKGIFHFGFDVGLLYGPNGYFRKGKHQIVPHLNIQLGILFK